MLVAITTMSGLTLALATLLILAHWKLYVREDVRIDVVETMLPSANCGACGYVGCRQFAEALIRQQAQPGKCTVSTAAQRDEIARFLGVDVGIVTQRTARLACAGGSNVARFRAEYHGLSSCRAAALVAGGTKSCPWGCLGLGDCERVCDFDAIYLDAQNLPVVVEELCTACGDCVDVCPKDLFSLHPIEHRLWVNCKNQEFGDAILEYCQVACTACAKCAMDAEDDLVVMQNNLAVVNYGKNHRTRVPTERCPTGAIVWIEADGAIMKGRESKKIIRKTPLMAQMT